MYFTPVATDRPTLEEISEALGTTTAVHETVSQSQSAWGLLRGTTVGTQRHERPLRYPDELARMSDEACLVLTKGHAPVQARKLDANPAAIQALMQQAKPVARTVALAAAACRGRAGWASGRYGRRFPSLHRRWALTTIPRGGQERCASPGIGHEHRPWH